MTARDRLVVTIVAAIAIIGAAYLLVVSPERKKASTVSSELNSATVRLTTAESKLAEARQAQARYSAAYASIVTLGKAVPTSEEVPSLIYELAQATHQKKVDFSSIVSGSGAGGSGAAGSSAGATAAASAGFTQMPFTFVFNGTYKDLYDLFSALNHFTFRTSSGGLQVNGRLLTIQSVKLAPVDTGTTAATHVREELTGTVTATAYVLPVSQNLTGGGSPSAPARRSCEVSLTKICVEELKRFNRTYWTTAPPPGSVPGVPGALQR